MKESVASTARRVTWPAIPSPAGARMLAMLFQLDRTQWLSADEILANQWRQLRNLLAYATSHVPRFQRLRDVCPIDEREFPGAWADVPVLTRAELQERPKDLLSEEFASGAEKVFEIRSSGSTGRPVRVIQNAEVQFFWHVFTLREHFWHRRDPSLKLATIRHYREQKHVYPGGSKSGWGPSMETIHPSGPLAVLNSRTDIALQARWLQEQQPAYLLTYPSNLKLLARHFLEQGRRVDSLRQVRCLGETVDGEARRICRAAFGVDIADMYSAQEVGYLALQCPQREGAYHVQSENVLLEVVADDGTRCEPGETGRVLVTSLHNFAMPLVRYEIGDYAVAGAPCTCGRGLPVLERIVGRTRNMLVLPDGTRHWPTFGGHSWSEVLPIRQFQFVQTGIDRIEARLVVHEALSSTQEAAFAGELRNKLGYPFYIEFKYVDDIPRSPSGKFEDFKSDIAAASLPGGAS